MSSDTERIDVKVSGKLICIYYGWVDLIISSVPHAFILQCLMIDRHRVSWATRDRNHEEFWKAVPPDYGRRPDGANCDRKPIQ
jgi:hypothetical protein